MVDQPAFDGARTEDRDAARPALGRRIGGYRIVRELGRGGMGVVYEALQEQPRRTVALKVLTGAHGDSREVVRRFEREAEVLGRLQHPGIAQIFEAGQFETQAGTQPFFAMELVRGETLTVHVARNQLGIRERLELVARIADAVQHAHERGVIHRDLKPGNLLVDETGQPKVLDFGIARLTDADLRTVTLQTGIGQVIGTIPYMSPEQASGDPTLLDTRSDVYSLGVVAYELVGGCLPYELDLTRVLEAVRTVREEEPRPLSSVDIRLRGDVETIVGKALEKDPERRYPSAAALAADLRRFLDDEPIAARRPSHLYQLRKFARRNRALVTGLSGVFVALLVGLVGTTRGYVEARRGRAQADEARLEAVASADRARRTSQFLRTILGGISPTIAQGEDTTLLRRILADTEGRMATELAGLPLAEAEIRQSLGLAYAALGDPVAAEPHLRRAFELFRELEGPTSESTLSARSQVGSITATLGRYDEAEELLRGAAADARRTLGTDAPTTLSIEKALAVLLHDTHRLEESSALMADLLARMERNPEIDAGTYLDACIPYSTLLLELDRDDEAERFLDEVVARSTAELGESHPTTIEALFNRASLDMKHSRSDDVLERHRDVFERSRRVYGEDHSITRTAARTYAQLLRDMAHWDEAEEILNGVLRSCERKLGPENRQTLSARRALALVWIRQGRRAEAEEALLEATTKLGRVLGPDHQETVDAQQNLADLYRQQGRHEEAARLLEQVIASIERRPEGGRNELLQARGSLANCFARLDRLEEAEVLQRAVLAEHLAVEGPDHPQTLVDQTSLALTLNSLGRTAEAEAQFAVTVAGHRRALGDDHPETGTVLYNTGAFYQESGRPLLALPYLAEGIAIWLGHVDPDHPQVRAMLPRLLRTLGGVDLDALAAALPDAERESLARDLGRVAHGLLRHERGAEALFLLEAALQLRAELDLLDPRMAWTQTLYGAALLFEGRPDEAAPLLESAQGFLDPQDAARLAEAREWLGRLERASAGQ